MDTIEEFIIKLKEYGRQNFIPIVRDNTIEKINEIIKKEGYKNILEIGTAIGYSGIIMLAGNADVYLTTIEKDENRFNEALDNFKKAKFVSRVNSIKGDAKNELTTLLENGDKFDFIFLDGPKGQYIKYLPIIKKLLIGGGTLFADNILLGGLVKDESKVNHKNRTMVKNMKEFIHTLSNDNDFYSQIYEIDDGFIVSKLKNSTDK